MIAGAQAAPSAELAKKCAALTAKAFPPRVVGNPAAGSTKGNGPSQQLYFNECVAKGGEVGELGPSQGGGPQGISTSPERAR
jgi:hypothetical protein